MLTKNEEEEIIGLINNGIDLELLSFELGIPIDQINEYNKQLQIRRFIKQSIDTGKEKEAIKKLEDYINSSENCIVEKMLLIKLKAYCDKRNVSDDELKQIEEDKIKTRTFKRNR